MALFSFGKKDKNPPEAPASVGKASPTPPKIQTPPASGPVPVVKPPQPAGLMPVTGMPAGAATTQPMIMPRGLGGGLKPARPGVAQSVRSTQRIVLPSAGLPGGQGAMTKALGAQPQSGRVNLPIGMILRCLPPEVLAADISEFETSGAAATEIGLPMNMILSQLPSGKVEMTLQDLVPHFPSGYLQPTESIANYLPNLISLPLMDVVMRIPPDLLALRPDQKDVDSAVINMADPFTEEILREQAEAARRQTEANIIDENQVPQAEEFVPQAQAPAPKTIAPPPRPPSVPLPTLTGGPSLRPPSVPLPTPTGGPSLRPPSPALPTSAGAPPIPPATKLPGSPASPTTTGSVRANSPVPPSAPSAATRIGVATGRLPVPTRATMPIVTRSSPAETAATPPVSPGPSSVPAPPPPRQATPPPVAPPALRPPVAAPTPPVPVLPKPTAAAAELPAATPPSPEEAAEAAAAPIENPTVAVPSPQADEGADELQRLAALAMAELGDREDESNPAPAEEPEQVPSVPEPEPEPEPVPEAAMVEEPVQQQSPPAPEPEIEREPLAGTAQPPLFQQAPHKGITEPIPTLSSLEAAKRKSEPEPTPAPASVAGSTSVAINLNSCGAEDLLQIPGCSRELAESIVQHRNKIGSFKKLEDLYNVPGMTKIAYTSLTGEAPLESASAQTLNELLGFSAEQKVSLKDVTDRIACWPDVTGCVLSQSSGLSLVGSVPAGLDKAALVAFAPRMFESLNKSFHEVAGRGTDELIIPTSGTSFHILRNKDLYLIILSRLPQMPDRHIKVARMVLAELSVRQN
jgi:hypothetical protein